MNRNCNMFIAISLFISIRRQACIIKKKPETDASASGFLLIHVCAPNADGAVPAATYTSGTSYPGVSLIPPPHPASARDSSNAAKNAMVLFTSSPPWSKKKPRHGRCGFFLHVSCHHSPGRSGASGPEACGLSAPASSGESRDARNRAARPPGCRPLPGPLTAIGSVRSAMDAATFSPAR